MIKISLLVLLSFIFSSSVCGQSVDLSQIWPAHWIAHPDGPHKEYAVFHFRKTFELDEVPDSLIIHTSGDNRYQLYIARGLGST